VHADGGDEACHVSIAGNQEGALKAEQAVHNLLRFSFPGQYYRVQVPEALAREIQRTRFKTLQELEEAHSVKIQLRHNHLYVRGPAVSDCEAAVAKMLQDHRDMIVVLPVDNSLFGVIIGNKGANIRKISESAGGQEAVQIDVDRTNNRILISGKTKEATATVKAAIQAVVDEQLAKQIIFDVPESLAGDVIGRGGATILKCVARSLAC
jgi:transcription antitermination factor NusA-like protein